MLQDKDIQKIDELKPDFSRMQRKQPRNSAQLFFLQNFNRFISSCICLYNPESGQREATWPTATSTAERSERAEPVNTIL